MPESDRVGRGDNGVPRICNPVDEELVGDLRRSTGKGPTKEVDNAFGLTSSRGGDIIACNLHPL